MKIDAMTGLAVGFAAFAAWYVLKPKSLAPATGADVAFGQARSQRKDVGANVWQNDAWSRALQAEQASAYYM